MHGFIGIATFLIDAEADVNAEAAPLNGRTALEAAAEHGRLDMVTLLLDSGVKTSGSGRPQYLRAQGFAQAYGHLVVADVLRSHNGDSAMSLAERQST